MFDVLYEVPSAFNTTLAVSARGCIVERLLAFVGYAMKWKETGVGVKLGGIGYGLRIRERRDHLIYDVTGPSVQPDAVTIMPRP